MDGTGRVAQTLIKTMLPGSRQDALKAKHDTWLRCFLIHFHRPLDAGFKGTSIVSSRWGSSPQPNGEHLKRTCSAHRGNPGSPAALLTPARAD